MNLTAPEELARQGNLYPSVILHGGDGETRRSAALGLARILLCEAPAADRPCGSCRHCKRIVWPEQASDTFHPDFRVLEQDLRTATSVGATKTLLQMAQLSPFEARGQVFVIANAESLTGEAANALLKTLEEPHTSAPRHFLLLTPSQLDLLPTVRSRSLPVFLGLAERLDQQAVNELAEEIVDCLREFEATDSGVHLLAIAEVLGAAASWQDPRAAEPWTLAAAAVRRAVDLLPPSGRGRRQLLALAEDLLNGWQPRLRGISAQRILEGLVSGRLSELVTRSGSVRQSVVPAEDRR
jgi:DNA polymerase-3 subunit delta'